MMSGSHAIFENAARTADHMPLPELVDDGASAESGADESGAEGGETSGYMRSGACSLSIVTSICAPSCGALGAGQ